MRKRLIELIVNHSGEELNRMDYMKIAAESEEELLERINGILAYYVDELNHKT